MSSANDVQTDVSESIKGKNGDRVKLAGEKMMFWTERHDVLMCREILTQNPFQHKKSSTQRGQIWHEISEQLVMVKEVKFKADLDRRAVRDRYNLLSNKLRRKLKSEEKASGIETNMSEVEQALEELIEREDESEVQIKESLEENHNKKRIDRAQAEEMRAKALEKLGETQKRKQEKGTGKRKRSRASDAVEFLRERNEMMNEIRKEELEMQKIKQEGENTRHQEFLQVMMQQQKQQQDMQAMMLQQQQQQNQIMLSLLSKLVP